MTRPRQILLFLAVLVCQTSYCFAWSWLEDKVNSDSTRIAYQVLIQMLSL